MPAVKRVNPSHIVVKYTHGRYQGRIQTSISFEERYVDALRSALELVTRGYRNIEIIQYRDVLHTQSQLEAALHNLPSSPTDEDVIEQVHHASRAPEYKGLAHWLRSGSSAGALVWANL